MDGIQNKFFGFLFCFGRSHFTHLTFFIIFSLSCARETRKKKRIYLMKTKSNRTKPTRTNPKCESQKVNSKERENSLDQFVWQYFLAEKKTPKKTGFHSFWDFFNQINQFLQKIKINCSSSSPHRERDFVVSFSN